MNSSISTDCEGPRPRVAKKARRRVAKKECRRPRSSRRRSRCFLNQYEGPRTQALQNKKERSCEPEKVGMVGSWGLEPSPPPCQGNFARPTAFDKARMLLTCFDFPNVIKTHQLSEKFVLATISATHT